MTKTSQGAFFSFNVIVTKTQNNKYEKAFIAYINFTSITDVYDTYCHRDR